MKCIVFVHSRQCSREAVRDGFCKQHHPTAEDARKAAANAREAARIVRDPLKELKRLRLEHDAMAAFVRWAHSNGVGKVQLRYHDLVDLEGNLRGFVLKSRKYL